MSINKKCMIRTVLLVGIISLVMAIPVLAAKIAVPQNIRWEGTKACWDEAEDAYKYEVRLYKNGTKYATISTSGTSLELSGRMKEKGSYTFRVKVRDRISDEYGSLSVSSDVYVQEKNITTNTSKKRTAKTTSKSEPLEEKNPGPGVTGRGWQEDEYGWWYRNDDGTYLFGGWHQIDKKWYYFDTNGYIQAGWITVEGAQYYCYPDGSRATGWSEISEGYYYFDENGVYSSPTK